MVALIGAVMGTIVAWVLVRDDFPGKRIINALIDLPFALPTIVAGLTLLALYGPDSPFGVHLAYTRAAVVVALLFVTLPFVVRSVQPVLLELDREVEEAAASLGASNAGHLPARSCCPRCARRSCPGRRWRSPAAVGEIGSLVLIVGKVQIASIVIFADIETDAPQAAASLSLVLIAALAARARADAPAGRPRCSLAAAPGCRCARSRCCTCCCCCCCRSASCSSRRSSTASASPGAG